MQNTQFSIAVHMLAGLGSHAGECVPSRMLAVSLNANPSFVRRVLAKLSKAGLVKTTAGKNGSCALTREPRRVTLLEVYKAVEAGKVFAIHEYPEQKSCAISCGIKGAMEKVLEAVQSSMESRLAKTTLADVLKDLR